MRSTSPNGATKTWLYSQAGQMVFWSDWDGAGYLNQKTHDTIYLQGSVIATLDRAWPSNAVLAVNYQHTDMLGSPVAVTNASGQVTERNDYEPYGAIIGKPNRSGIGYTGHVMDGGTSLTYMQQRYYDQSVGRFLSVDPVTAVGSGDMHYFPRYSYALNSPYRFRDPDGRAGVDTVGQDARWADPEFIKANAAWAQQVYDSPQGGMVLDVIFSVIVDVFTGGPNGDGVVFFGGLRAARAANNADNANDAVAAGVRGGRSADRKPRNAPPGPDPAAEGRPHSRIERPGADGQYTTHNGDGTYKQYRGSGQDHGGIPRPNVKENNLNTAPNGQQYPGKPEVRPARPDEIPGD